MNDWWETFFGTFSFLAAGLAAHLWFRASKINLPPSTSDDWDGKGPFSDALAKQSRMNSHAALAATFAALFQALSMGAKVLGQYLHIQLP
jgi:hypothetical protein